MPLDATLYPHHKPKTTPKEISTTSSLAFASTLNTLLSSSKPTSVSTSGRPRPSRTKPDIFNAHNKNHKKRAAQDLLDLEHNDDNDGRGSSRKRKVGNEQRDIGSVDAAVLHRSKRKLEQKAKIYNRLKRGDIPETEGDTERLVDFDTKWAERQGKADTESDSDIGFDDAQGEMVDYEDEYGRARHGTRAEAEKMERRKRNALLGAEELDRMSARPAMPSKLIYGDTVQSLAFNPEEEQVLKMEALAGKRDRSLTPPEMGHYDADGEVRERGTGFYKFSREEGGREREMKELEREREETEQVRREGREKRDERRKLVEERRRVVGEMRARKEADRFLEGLEGGFRREGEGGM